MKNTTIFKRLLGYLKAYRLRLFFVLLSAVISTAFMVLAPFLVGKVTTTLFASIADKVFYWETIIWLLAALVPQKMNAHPFFAKATLAYFPQSDRNQGVDYTSTEMDIHFGRIKGQDEKAVIKAIDYNKQAEEGLNTIYEEDARKLYRKWDNVKHISEALKENGRPRKVYQSGLWGLSIKTKERLDPKAGRGLRFGIVVTLREMNGENRIDDFIKMCMMRGWIVNRLDVQAQADVYFKAEEEITFE